MTALSNRLHRQIQGQGETANQGIWKASFHEVSGGDRPLWQTGMPRALSPYNVFQGVPQQQDCIRVTTAQTAGC